jgi:hypothetical protein
VAATGAWENFHVRKMGTLSFAVAEFDRDTGTGDAGPIAFEARPAALRQKRSMEDVKYRQEFRDRG